MPSAFVETVSNVLLLRKGIGESIRSLFADEKHFRGLRFCIFDEKMFLVVDVEFSGHATVEDETEIKNAYCISRCNLFSGKISGISFVSRKVSRL